VVDEEAIAAAFGRCIGDGGVDVMDSFPFAAVYLRSVHAQACLSLLYCAA
jgi:hypothetical protein